MELKEEEKAKVEENCTEDTMKCVWAIIGDKLINGSI